MLGSVALKELNQSKLMVPFTQTTLKDFSPYKYPLSIGGYLANG